MTAMLGRCMWNKEVAIAEVLNSGHLLHATTSMLAEFDSDIAEVWTHNPFICEHTGQSRTNQKLTLFHPRYVDTLKCI